MFQTRTKDGESAVGQEVSLPYDSGDGRSIFWVPLLSRWTEVIGGLLVVVGLVLVFYPYRTLFPDDFAAAWEVSHFGLLSGRFIISIQLGELPDWMSIFESNLELPKVGEHELLILSASSRAVAGSSVMIVISGWAVAIVGGLLAALGFVLRRRGRHVAARPAGQE